MQDYDVVVIGGGAAGLMAALQAGRRGRRILLIEHTAKIGEKIRISGGGRCNFTNLGAGPANYLCSNPHFVKSALAGFTQRDFIKMVQDHGIQYHEKTLGQLFCDGSSKQIIQMLLDECAKAQVKILLSCRVNDIGKSDQFSVVSDKGTFIAQSVIIATGGLSIPQIGASDFGYRIAKKFGVSLRATRPALVSLTVGADDLQQFRAISGISNASIVSYGNTKFSENILFTHRGLSGPAILQISSYLPAFSGEKLSINLLPSLDLSQLISQNKDSKKTLCNFLKQYLSDRLVDFMVDDSFWHRPMTEVKKSSLLAIADRLHNFPVTIQGSEGYQKAEVTIGGVDTDYLSSKTMMVKNVPGLFFIGEVVDVTGWLGGYNFQWAWSSGYAAGLSC
ncbi:membrane protein [Candidatus Paracaedibacter acanthamoebae]|uniref:Membrane protein n=2 Tax=Candidatus Odyssella acanthamoebae TaxID=91604 RepID=A0A077ASH2_9PROT|nr:membrane protein [Candidatus Paracaedibacter acanthamoebae]